MKILMFGGTRFFGKQVLKYLIDHEIVVVSRKIPDITNTNITHIQLERDHPDILKKICFHAPYDMVFDNIAYQPQQIEMIYESLYDNPPRTYMLTSTVAVYFDQYNQSILNENDQIPSGFQDELFFDAGFINYAYGKYKCELFLKNQSRFPYIILRLPFVAGPGDFSFRLAYFIHRIRKGEIVIPENAVNIQQLFSNDIPKVVFELSKKIELFSNQIINITPDAILVSDFIKLLAETMNCNCNIITTSLDEWKNREPDFPYFYNQIMSNEKYHTYFEYTLTKMEKFLPITLSWYLSNEQLWKKNWFTEKK